MYKVTIATTLDRTGKIKADDVIMWFYEAPCDAEILETWKRAHYNVFDKTRWANMLTTKVEHV